MSRFLFPIVAIALAAPVLVAAPVPADAGKPVTFPYPGKAPIVVCLNGYDKARDRLAGMLKAAMPDDATRLTKQFNDLIGKMLEGRKLTGVRKDARAFLVLNDLGGLLENRVPVSVLVPVTTAKEFRETFFTKAELKSYEKGKDGVDSIKTSATGEEATVYLVDLNEYVAATTDKAVADTYAGKFTRASSETMGPEIGSAYLKADVALFVNMDAINDQFGDQIRNFRGLIDFGIQQGQQQGVFGGVTKKQLEAIKTVLKGLFQAVEDCRALAVTAEFKPEGLLVRLQARFAENTPSAKLIQSETSYPLKGLEKLPKGFDVYSEMRLGPTLTQLMQEFAMEFAAPDDDEKTAAVLEKFMKERTAAGPEGMWSANDLAAAGIGVSGFKDPAKALHAEVQMFKALPAGGRGAGMVLKTAPKVNENSEKYQGISFTEIRLQIDYEASVASLPEAAREAALENLKRTVPEKSVMWLGANGKTVLTVTAKDWEKAKAILDKYLSGQNALGGDPAFKATRDQLPADATTIMIGETASTISGFYDQIKTSLQALPGGIPQLGELKKVKGEPTYAGLALSTKGETVGVTIFVPTGSMAVARKMLEPLFKNVE